MTMIDGSLLSMAVLTTVALSLIVWETLWPRSSKALVPNLALGALALAFAASGHVAFDTLPFDMAVSPRDELLQIIVRGLFLGTVAISLLRDWSESTDADAPTRERYAVRLLAACGGVLALSSANLLTLWVGIELYSVAGLFAQKRDEAVESLGTIRILGAITSLLGLALVYESTGSFDIAALSRFLWEHGGPRSPVLYAGLSLAIGGIALGTGLLPPYRGACLEDDVASPVLGVALLLRLYLFGLGALSWEWFWVLMLLALMALIWGWVSSLWGSGAADRLARLSISQRGFLLWALALTPWREGIEVLLAALLAFALAQVVLHVGLHWLRSSSADSEPDGLLPGLARHTPWVGIPLLVSLLSLAGAPATLGFVGRAYALWMAQKHGPGWLAPAGVVMSILCAWFYLPVAISLLRKPSPETTETHVSLSVVIGIALASMGLIVLGLYPTPLKTLALWITGG